jgi:methylenetetrahydrofolate reductase (NADPH)
LSPAFSDELARGFFASTTDLLPGRSGEPLLLTPGALGALRSAGCAVNVADMPSAILAQAPIAAAVALMQAGIEPILQFTGRDRNRLALQADLLAAHALGVRNVLCLTGDHTALGDHPHAPPVFDLSSTEMLGAVAQLNAGLALGGRPLEAPTEFTAGAAVNPTQKPLEPQLARAVAKERAGASFFQTQPLFRTSDVDRFLGQAAEAGLKAPVLVGVFLLESAVMARFMNEKVPGVVVPREVVTALEEAEDPVAYGIELTLELVAYLRESHGSADESGGVGAGVPGVVDGVPRIGPVRPPRPAGVHVMSLNRHVAVAGVLGAKLPA